MIIGQQRQTAMQTAEVRPTQIHLLGRNEAKVGKCYGVISFHRSSATAAATWAALPVKPVLLVFALDHTSPPASAGHACQRVLTLDNARLYLPTPAHAGANIHSRPYTHPHKHTFLFGRRSHPRQACSTPVSGLRHVCSARSSTKKPLRKPGSKSKCVGICSNNACSSSTGNSTFRPKQSKYTSSDSFGPPWA